VGEVFGGDEEFEGEGVGLSGRIGCRRIGEIDGTGRMSTAEHPIPTF
jgi:hypothetical protein